MLTREAFNALLKTLEEPPPHILFVFATTEPHKIPATILSRCQRYDFKRIPLNEILENLKHVVREEEVRVSEGALLAIARESEGSMRDAQSLLDQVISFEGKEIRDEGVLEVLGLIDRKVLFDTLEAIAGQDAGRCVEIIEQIYDFGYDIQHFCRELLQYLRHLILLKVSRDPEPLMALPKEEMEVLRGLAGKFQFDQLNHLFSLLLKGEEEVAQSTFPRTMLEMTLIRMATLKSIRTIEEILNKLERLENAEGPVPGVKPSPSRVEGRGLPQARRQAEGPGVDPERHSSPAPSKTRHGAAEGGKEIHKKPDEEKAAVTELSKDPAADTDLSPAFSVMETVESAEEDDAPITETAPVPGSLQKQENVESKPPAGHEETWKAFVDFARARNPILGSFLVFGELVHLSEDRIEIGFGKGSFHYDRMLEKENQSLLAEICQDYLQRNAKVIVLPLEEGLKNKNGKTAEEKGTAPDSGEKASDKGNGKHPLIQEALRLFNGKIVEG
jgi:DNA polymerase-3 subunit gamma/tau